MQIVRVTNDETYQHIIHFDDGTRAFFLRPEHYQAAPVVKPFMSYENAFPYIEAAFNWLSERAETANLPQQKAIRIKVVGDGFPLTTQIINADTGERIEGVRRVVIDIDATQLLNTATLEFQSLDLDVIANLPVTNQYETWNDILRRLQDLYDTWANDHGSNTENVMQALDRLMEAYDKWLD